jgi:hypothetical protein
MDEDIELLDLWTRFGEEYLQEVVSTPDVKLYYPEPFIASPSFVHEELCLFIYYIINTDFDLCLSPLLCFTLLLL